MIVVIRMDDLEGSNLRCSDPEAAIKRVKDASATSEGSDLLLQINQTLFQVKLHLWGKLRRANDPTLKGSNIHHCLSLKELGRRS